MGRVPLIFAALLVAACNEPAPPAAPPVEIKPVALKQCPTPDPGRACEYDHATAEAEMAKAMAGDYQAQRNVAAMHTTATEWITPDPVQGCAWRMVIMATRPAVAPFDDAGMYRVQCGGLDSPDRAQARRVADAIHHQVKGGPLPPQDAGAAS